MDTPEPAGAHVKDTSQLHRFFDDVEDLLRRLTPLDDERVAHIRGRVEDSLASAREATDNYVHQSPWQAMMLAGITGIALAMLVTPRRGS
jgi:ElaB/YqjD/DUF883 family membrane-anchored ribosome-binding protein